MTTITKEPFGVTMSGEPVERYVLDNGSMKAGILTYGGILQFLYVPDRKGTPLDVVLGYDTLAEYEKGDKYLGALIGRHANRIGGAVFTLNGKEYPLFDNDKGNHLHGGKCGFDKKVWNAEICGGDLKLTYTSVDGEEGYPGTLVVTVTYSLTEENTLVLDYKAISDADTVCNLTNHSYFNLAGQDSGDVLAQKIQVFGSYYTVTDEKSIPTGEIAAVEGTPMDLRQPTVIGDKIDDSFEQLAWAGGYDNNWLIDGQPGTLRKMAYAFDEGTGITLTGCTTLPGMQFYAGNYLDGVMHGKGKSTNGRRCGFCLESQYFPNAIHCPNFIQPVLKAQEQFHAVTTYQFGTL
ncbi:MAG: aldose epimerase family protein [Candidatus Merdivicinus sp.]|jgi:aldose 1-epimerase